MTECGENTKTGTFLGDPGQLCHTSLDHTGCLHITSLPFALTGGGGMSDLHSLKALPEFLTSSPIRALPLVKSLPISALCICNAKDPVTQPSNYKPYECKDLVCFGCQLISNT